MFLYRIQSTGQFVPTKPTSKGDQFEKVEIPANGNRVAMCDYLNGLVTTPAESSAVESEPVLVQTNHTTCPKCKLNTRQASATAEHYVRTCGADAKENWIAEEADMQMVNRLLGAAILRLQDLRRLSSGEDLPIRTRLRPGGVTPGLSQSLRDASIVTKKNS